MFTYQHVRDRLKATPFLPVRFVLSTGQTYDIYHPDLVWVSRSTLRIGIPSMDDPTLPERGTDVSIIHLTEMIDLPQPQHAPQMGNGAA